MKSPISPFKKKSHSREPSLDHSHAGSARHSNNHSHLSGSVHKRTISGSSVSKNNSSYPPPVSGNTHNRSVSRSSNTSQNSNFLAEQYDRDLRAIIASCFNRPDPKTNSPPNTYLTHVRIIEDAKYPSSRPGPDSKLEYKKKRVLILSKLARDEKIVQIHKARENADGSFQIGRTWLLKDLTKVERDLEIPEGFLLTIGKRYYWETNSARERTVFVRTLVNTYFEKMNNHVPVLVNWNLDLFHLDERSYARAVINHEQKRNSTVVNEQTPSAQPIRKPSSATPSNITSSQYASTTLTSPSINQQQSRSPLRVHPEVSPIRTNVSPSRRYANIEDEGNNNMAINQPKKFGQEQARVSLESNKNRSSLSKTPYSTHTTINEVSRNYTNPEQETEILPSPRDPRHSYRQEHESHPYQAMMSGKHDSNKYSNQNETYPTPTHEEEQVNINQYERVDYGAYEDNNNIKSNKLVPQLTPATVVETTSTEVIEPHSVETQELNDNLMDDLNAMLGENIENQKSLLNHNEREVQLTPNFEPEGTKQQEREGRYTGNDTLDPDLNETSTEYNHPNYQPTPDRLSRQDIQEEREEEEEESMDDLNALPERSDEVDQNLSVQYRIANHDISDIEMNQTSEIANDLSFERGDEIRYSQVLEQPLSPHQYHEVTTIQEEEHTKLPGMTDENPIPPIENKKAGRIDITDEILLEALTDVNWEVIDDTDDLCARLDNKLIETTHTFNKELLNLQDIKPFLEPYEKNVEQECSKMNPAFSLFLMDLNNLAQDIDFVERQDNGFQIESANKKLLWSTLSDLLNTVSLDEATLKELLKCPIRERNLPWMEAQLSSLSKALKAINGETNDEENDLRDMEAMKKRHRYYEKVTELFLARLVEETATLFSGIKIDGTNEQLVSTLQRLLVYSPLICFCKEISEESFNSIVENWNKHIQIVYNGLWARLFKEISNDLQLGLVPEKGILQQGNIESLLTQWQKFKQTKEMSFVSPTYLPFLSEISDTLDFIQQHCIIYQNFVNAFFHIKSMLPFTEYVAKYSDPSTRVVSLDQINRIDSDRESASVGMTMVAKIFQPIISELSSFLNELAKVNSSIQPSIMLILEEKITSLESSNQEFLFTAFKRLYVQLQNLWTDFTNIQSLSFERITPNDFNKELLPPVFGYPLFVKNIGDSLSCVIGVGTNGDFNDSQTSQLLFTSYSDVLETIIKVLKKKKSPQSISSVGGQLLNETSLIETVTLLTNYNWLIELLTMMNTKCNGIFDNQLQICKETFDSERNIYAGHLLHNLMPKLKSFVDGATRVEQNNISSSATVSHWGAYSRQNLEIILNGYTSNDIQILVTKLYKHMLQDITIEQPEIIHNVLRDKLWSSLQGQTVSMCLKVYTLVDKHYRGVQIKFNKNDIISAFEQYKE